MSQRRTRGPLPPPPKGASVHSALLLDLALVLATIFCFWPIVRFFFAQDDFVLLEQASQGVGSAVGGFFEARPGQFRPLTKGLYFLVTWPLFGLNATPFHVLSVMLHAANAVLVTVALRRMGIAASVSRLAAALFAFNVAFLETVAWVSCVQQLIGNAFMLLALIFGVDALAGRGTRRRVASGLALALALASYEQVLAAPVVLLMWHAMHHGVRATVVAARTRLWEQGVILLVYLLFTLGVRGVPGTGPYVMSIGAHVLDNLRTYTALAYELWIVFPAYGLPAGFTVSHAALIAVVAYLLARRRFREVAFGLATFLAFLAPVLFVKEHTHSFHLYVPALGTWFLAAVAIQDAVAVARARFTRAVTPLLTGVGAAVFAVSATMVRENVNAVVSEDFQLPRSFVLRREVLAERMRDDILARSRLRGKPGRMILVYLYPEFRANWLNVYAALGQGSGVRMILESPDLDLVFTPPADPPPDDPSIEVMVYTELGRCYTAAEVEEAERRRAARRAAGTATPSDTTTTGE